MRLPTKDSSAWRGLITAAQGFVGASGVIAAGFFAATKEVPGCNEAVMQFFFDNILFYSGAIGVSGGAVSTLWNMVFRNDVKDY